MGTGDWHLSGLYMHHDLMERKKKFHRKLVVRKSCLTEMYRSERYNTCVQGMILETFCFR
jgi:hypothetical protein